MSAVHRPDLGVCCRIADETDEQQRAEIKRAKDAAEIRGTWQGALLTAVLALVMIGAVCLWMAWR